METATRNSSIVIASNPSIATTSSNMPNTPIFDSGTSISIFKNTTDAEQGTYRKGSNDIVELAAGLKPVHWFGTVDLEVDNISLHRSLNTSHFNNALLSVGKICDQNEIVTFTNSKGEVLVVEGFDVDADKVIAIAKRNYQNGLY